MLYEFELDHNAVETTKMVQEILSELQEPRRLSRPNTVDTEAVLKALYSPARFVIFMTSAKASRAVELCFTLSKY